MNPKRTLLALVLVLLLGGARASAQEPPTLDRVEELARLGRAEEARVAVHEWWRTAGPKASRRDTQRGLWLRGQLTSDATQAALDFNRLVVEYPGGPFSDLALLRLAQASYAAGDSAAAATQVERLLHEYPSSPIRSEAEAWLATAGPVPIAPGAAATSAAPADSAGAPAAPAARREAVSAPPTVPTAADAATPEGTGEFTIQLGAFSTVARAEALLRQLTDAGFTARLATVPGSDLVRVRLGRFDSAEGAEAILWQVRDRGFTATVARDAHREELVVR
ncbi:MAG TPA: SPOR domain-containing protein [Longimicrobiales bacterium]|nr:SPOR domain-containing protein [Longimicrobiales bacterium]